MNIATATSSPYTSSPTFVAKSVIDTPVEASETEKQRLYDVEWPPLQPKVPLGTCTKTVETISRKSEQAEDEKSSGDESQVPSGPWEEGDPLVSTNGPSQTSIGNIIGDRQWTKRPANGKIPTYAC